MGTGVLMCSSKYVHITSDPDVFALIFAPLYLIYKTCQNNLECYDIFLMILNLRIIVLFITGDVSWTTNLACMYFKLMLRSSSLIMKNCELDTYFGGSVSILVRLILGWRYHIHVYSSKKSNYFHVYLYIFQIYKFNMYWCAISFLIPIMHYFNSNIEIGVLELCAYDNMSHMMWLVQFYLLRLLPRIQNKYCHQFIYSGICTNTYVFEMHMYTMHIQNTCIM